MDVNQDQGVDVQLESLPSGTAFDAGRRLVNDEIAPGQYFASPVSGCFWKRLGATGGVIASSADTRSLGAAPVPTSSPPVRAEGNTAAALRALPPRPGFGGTPTG